MNRDAFFDNSVVFDIVNFPDPESVKVPGMGT